MQTFYKIWLYENPIDDLLDDFERQWQFLSSLENLNFMFKADIEELIALRHITLINFT